MSYSGQSLLNKPDERVVKRGIGITPMAVIDWAAGAAGITFTIDGCASADNARLAKYVDEAEDFMTTRRDWTGEAVWLNPPYVKGKTGKGYTTGDFVRRARDIRDRYGCPVVVLLEANMVGTSYFAKHVGSTPADRRRLRTELICYPTRINFLNMKPGNPKSSILVVYKGGRA